MAATATNLFAKLSLAEDRIARDHTAFQDQGFEDFQGPLVFVGLRVDTRLAQHTAGALVQQGQSMHGSLVRLQRAAQSFAVQGDGLEELGHSQATLGPIR